MFRFEKLEVWRKSVLFADTIYKATVGFPSTEMFGLTSQLRRSAVSIGANLAEGSSRLSDRDFARYVEIAYGSLCETVSHLRLAKLQGFISREDFRPIYQAAEELGKMLSGLRDKLGKWKVETR